MTRAKSKNGQDDDKRNGKEEYAASGSFYLDGASVSALKAFRYNGRDCSLIYQHVLSPLAQYCVDTFTPRSMAPNTITFLGFLLMISSYITVYYYCPELDSQLTQDGEGVEGGAQHWIFAYNGICMLVYQTLDNMDGKQARRTGSSSPLGLLFDHGCDAFNVIIGATNWCCAMGLNVHTDIRIICLICVAGYTPFFLTTWEEYHTGELLLPVINGPTEGLILGACLNFVSGWQGPAFWHGTQFYEALWRHILSVGGLERYARAVVGRADPSLSLRNCDCLMILTVVLLCQEAAGKLWTVLRKHGVVGPLCRIVPLASMFASFGLLLQGQDNALQRHPRMALNLSSLLFVEMTVQLMLDHMTLKTFNCWRPCVVPLILWSICTVPASAQLQDMLLTAYLAVVATYLAFKIRLVIHEICAALNIWCFDIVHSRCGAKKSQ